MNRAIPIGDVLGNTLRGSSFLIPNILLALASLILGYISYINKVSLTGMFYNILYVAITVTLYNVVLFFHRSAATE
jgi:hypothetical protein